MNIEKLFKDNPSFHAWDDGRPANFGVSDSVIEYISSKLKPGQRTLETGSGKSTLAFLMAGCVHISIAPYAAEEIRIRDYCKANKLDINYTFYNSSSSDLLPNLIHEIPDLDFILIDGAHRYPFAEIDYYYSEQKLKVGGYMVVDDIQLPSVRNLYLFLKKEKNWRLEKVIKKTAFFIKGGNEVVVGDWQNQGINQFYLRYSSVIIKLKIFIKSIINLFRK